MSQVVVPMNGVVMTICEDGQFALRCARSQMRLAFDCMRWTLQRHLKTVLDAVRLVSTATVETIAAPAIVDFLWATHQYGTLDSGSQAGQAYPSLLFLAPSLSSCSHSHIWHDGI
jgi:hypothetical protein